MLIRVDTVAANDELEALARRMIWWKPARESLKYRGRLLAQVMASGTWEDVQVAKRHWTVEEFMAVLKDPPAGVFDRRSWVYWHGVLRVSPVPHLSERRLPR